jgi:hypothetical protein
MFFSYTVLFTYSDKYFEEVVTMQQQIIPKNSTTTFNETTIGQNQTNTSTYSVNVTERLNMTQMTIVENLRPILRYNELIILLWIIGLMAEEIRQVQWLNYLN